MEDYQSMASIIIISGTNKGDYYPLGKRTTVIGRSETLPIQIVDPKISRKHFKISYDADNNKYTIADMESRHGIFVNGNRLSAPATLNDNDYITVGHTNIMFTLKNFEDRENALLHYKKVGERQHPTIADTKTRPTIPKQ